MASFIGLVQAHNMKQEKFARSWLFVSVGGYDRCATTVSDSQHPHDLPLKALVKVFLFLKEKHT